MPTLDARVMSFLDECCSYYSENREKELMMHLDGVSYTFREVRQAILGQSTIGNRLYEDFELLYHAKLMVDAREQKRDVA